MDRNYQTVTIVLLICHIPFLFISSNIALLALFSASVVIIWYGVSFILSACRDGTVRAILPIEETVFEAECQAAETSTNSDEDLDTTTDYVSGDSYSNMSIRLNKLRSRTDGNANSSIIRRHTIGPISILPNKPLSGLARYRQANRSILSNSILEENEENNQSRGNVDFNRSALSQNKSYVFNASSHSPVLNASSSSRRNCLTSNSPLLSTSPFLPRVQRALGLGVSRVNKDESLSSPGLSSALQATSLSQVSSPFPSPSTPGVVPMVRITRNRQNLRDRHVSVLNSPGTVKIAPPSSISLLNTSRLSISSADTLDTSSTEEKRPPPDTQTVLTALRECRKRSIVSQEDSSEILNQHSKRRKANEDASGSASSSVISEPEFLPDLSLNGYSVLPIHLMGLKRPATPTVDMEQVLHSDIHVLSPKRAKRDVRNNPILSSLSSAKRAAVKQHEDQSAQKRSRSSVLMTEPIAVRTRRSSMTSCNDSTSHNTKSVPSTPITSSQQHKLTPDDTPDISMIDTAPSLITSVIVADSTPKKANIGGDGEASRNRTPKKKLFESGIMGSRKKTIPLYGALNASFNKTAYSNVHVTVEDYEHDREAEKRRVKDMLHDIADDDIHKDGEMPSSRVFPSTSVITSNIINLKMNLPAIVNPKQSALTVTTNNFTAPIMSASPVTSAISSSTATVPTDVIDLTSSAAESSSSSSAQFTFKPIFGSATTPTSSSATLSTSPLSSSVITTSASRSTSNISGGFSLPISSGGIGLTTTSSSLFSASSAGVSAFSPTCTSNNSITNPSIGTSAFSLVGSNSITAATTATVSGFGTSLVSSNAVPSALPVSAIATQNQSISNSPSTPFQFGSTPALNKTGLLYQDTVTTPNNINSIATDQLPKPTAGLFNFGQTASSSTTLPLSSASSTPFNLSMSDRTSSTTASVTPQLNFASTTASVTPQVNFASATAVTPQVNFASTTASVTPHVNFASTTSSIPATGFSGFNFGSGGHDANKAALLGTGEGLPKPAAFAFAIQKATTASTGPISTASSTGVAQSSLFQFGTATAGGSVPNLSAFGTNQNPQANAFPSQLTSSGYSFTGTTTTANNSLGFNFSTTTTASTSSSSFNFASNSSATGFGSAPNLPTASSVTTTAASTFAPIFGHIPAATNMPTGSMGQNAFAFNSSSTATTTAPNKLPAPIFNFSAKNSNTSSTLVPAFGSIPATPAKSTVAFAGTDASSGSVFGQTAVASNQVSAFGSSSIQNNVSVFVQNQAPVAGAGVFAFGAAAAPNSMGADAFGQSSQQAVFGANPQTETNVTKPAFGTPTFGQQQPSAPNVNPFGQAAPNNNTNAFGSNKSTPTFGVSQNSSTPVFGQSNNQSASTFAFGVASNKNSSTPVFGQSNNSNNAGIQFGGAGINPGFKFGTTVQNTQVSSTTGPVGGVAKGFDFSAAMSNGPQFNFGTAPAMPAVVPAPVAAPPVGSFSFTAGSPAAGPAGFSLGTGDTAARPRTMARARRKGTKR